jgi:hypothetical protein
MHFSSVETCGVKEKGREVAGRLRLRGLLEAGPAPGEELLSSESYSLLCYTGGALSRAVLLTFRRTMMQDMITSLTTIMTWLVLLLCLVVVVLLGLVAWHLPSNRCRAFLGGALMALVVLATGVSLLLLSQKAQSWTWLLLPLAAPLLLVSLYRLSFPPQVPGSQHETRHQVLLLLTIGALLATGGLVLLDLLLP